MKDEILSYGPIVCGIHITEKFFQYTGGVFSQYSAITKPNHYVEIVGFGETEGKEFWSIRNSWGTAWGESGFARIQMHENNLGIEDDCYWGNKLF